MFTLTSNCCFSDDYAIPDVTKSALRVALPPTTNNLDKPPPRYDALYAAADLLHTQVPNIPSLQVVSLFFFILIFIETDRQRQKEGQTDRQKDRHRQAY